MAAGVNFMGIRRGEIPGSKVTQCEIQCEIQCVCAGTKRIRQVTQLPSDVTSSN